MPGPLDGFRIIDLSQVVSGPLGTMILADQGADVIKIEPVEGGDLTRISGGDFRGLNGFYANLNRGKRSLAVDLSSPEGVDIVLKLCETADVMVLSATPIEPAPSAALHGQHTNAIPRSRPHRRCDHRSTQSGSRSMNTW